MRRPRRNRNQRPFCPEVMCGEPTIGVASCSVAQAEFRGLPIRRDVEGTSCLEESLGRRWHVGGIVIPLEPDESSPRDSALRIPEPVPGRERPKEPTPQVPVEVEFVRVLGLTDLPRQAGKRVPIAELEDQVNSRIVAQEGTERSFGQDGEVTFGMPAAERSQQRGGKKNVAYGAESNDEDSEVAERGVWHGENVPAAEGCRQRVAPWFRGRLGFIHASTAEYFVGG